MRLVSFNINGVRARPHQLDHLKSQGADLIALQETKVANEQFPVEMVQEGGYALEIHGQKKDYGVATLSRVAPVEVQKGWSTDTEEAQKRLLICQYALTNDQRLTVINGYFPQGESRKAEIKFAAKKAFYADLLSYLNSRSKDELIAVVGDFNIAPDDQDIGIADPKRWLRDGKCAFLPEEREWLQSVMDWGLHDSFAIKHPERERKFSWFDYRSEGFYADPQRGLRIDMILCTAPLLAHLQEVGIDVEARAMEKASDHAPIFADFDLQLAP